MLVKYGRVIISIGQIIFMKFIILRLQIIAIIIFMSVNKEVIVLVDNREQDENGEFTKNAFKESAFKSTVQFTQPPL